MEGLSRSENVEDRYAAAEAIFDVAETDALALPHDVAKRLAQDFEQLVRDKGLFAPSRSIDTRLAAVQDGAVPRDVWLASPLRSTPLRLPSRLRTLGWSLFSSCLRCWRPGSHETAATKGVAQEVEAGGSGLGRHETAGPEGGSQTPQCSHGSAGRVRRRGQGAASG